MNRFFKAMCLTVGMTVSMCATAFAGSWQQDSNGWRWQEDNASYPKSVWQWIDGNGDGTAECYYFDGNGYLLTGTTTPDGYTVNSDGAWVVDGVIQSRAQSPAAASGADSDAKRLYQEANEKYAALSGMEAKASLDMSMSYQGEAVPAVITMDMKMKDLNTSNMKYLVNANVSMMGLNMDMTMFYTDGYYYVDFLGQKIRQKMDLNAMTAQVKDSTFHMDTDIVKNLQLAAGEGGNRVLSYEIDTDKLGGYMDSVYSATGVDSNEMRITAASGAMTVDAQANVISQTIRMSYVMSVEGEAVSGDMNIVIDYANLGQPVDFALPSTEGYQEAPAA